MNSREEKTEISDIQQLTDNEVTQLDRDISELERLNATYECYGAFNSGKPTYSEKANLCVSF